MPLQKAKFSKIEETIADNVRNLIRLRNINAKKLAQNINIAESSLSLFFKHRTGLSFSALERIANFFEIPFFQLLVPGDEILVSNPKEKTFNEENYEGVVKLSEVKCTRLGESFKGKIEGYHLFEKGYLKKFVNPILIKVKGDDMAPDLLDNDYVLVDRKEKLRMKPESTKYYLVNCAKNNKAETEAVIRRLYFDEPNNLLYVIPNIKGEIDVLDVKNRNLQHIVLGQVVRIERELQD